MFEYWRQDVRIVRHGLTVQGFADFSYFPISRSGDYIVQLQPSKNYRALFFDWLIRHDGNRNPAIQVRAFKPVLQKKVLLQRSSPLPHDCQVCVSTAQPELGQAFVEISYLEKRALYIHWAPGGALKVLKL